MQQPAMVAEHAVCVHGLACLPWTHLDDRQPGQQRLRLHGDPSLSTTLFQNLVLCFQILSKKIQIGIEIHDR